MLQLFLEAHWSLNNTPSIKSFPRYKMFSFNHIHMVERVDQLVFQAMIFWSLRESYFSVTYEK